MGLLNWVRRSRGEGRSRIGELSRPQAPCFEQLEPRVLLSADSFMPLESPLHDTPVESAIVVDYELASRPQCDGQTESGSEGTKVGSDEDCGTVGRSDSGTVDQLNRREVIPSCSQTVTLSQGLFVSELAASAELSAVQQNENQPSLTDASEDLELHTSNFSLQTSDLATAQNRGPPLATRESSTVLNEVAYMPSDENDNSSDVEGTPSLTPQNLTGLVTNSTQSSAFKGQIIYLDFDGAEDVMYEGSVTISDIDVPEFEAFAKLAGQEQAIISDILMRLNETFAGSGIFFITEKPGEEVEYSTVYIGGDDSAFSEYGSFLGLAEQVDSGNQDQKESAFVFTDNILGEYSSKDDWADNIASVIAHEVGHLVGYEHDRSYAEGEGILAEVAVEYVVDSLLDTVELDGEITLREAIEASNANAQAGDAEAGSSQDVDIIRFDASLAGGLIVLGGELSLSDDVEIEWLGTEPLTVDAGNNSRVVSVNSGVEAVIKGLTITGGGIRNSGTLTLANAAVSGGSIQYSHGGGIYNSGGTLTLTNTTVAGNSAKQGGGIFNNGTLTLTNSTISGNSADHSGGIFNNGSNTLTMHNTVVAINECQTSGADVSARLDLSSSHNFIGDALGVSGIADGDNGNVVGGGDPELFMEASNGRIVYYPVTGSPLTDAGDNSVVTQTIDMLGNSRIQGNSVDIGAIEGDYHSSNSLTLVSPDEGDVVQASQSDPIKIDVAAPTSATISVFLEVDGAIDGDRKVIYQDVPISIVGALSLKSAWSSSGTYVLTVAVNDESFITPMTDQAQFTITHPDQVVYMVDSLADTVEVDGELTLREALKAANTNTTSGDAVAGSAEDVDIIRFDLSLAGGSIVLGSELTLSDDVTIEWLEVANLSIDADNNSRVFRVDSDVEAVLTGLTITGGNSADSYGGGIVNSGTLTLVDMTVSGNSAYKHGDHYIRAGGGGIYNDSSGIMTLTNTVVSGNSAYMRSDYGFKGGGHIQQWHNDADKYDCFR